FNHLIEGVNIGTKGVALIQDLDMRIVARNPILETPNGQVGFVGAPPQLSALVRSGTPTGTIYTKQTMDDVPRTGNFRRLTTMPIFVIFAVGEDDYLAEWYRDTRRAILLGLLFMVVTSIAGWLLWHQIRANMLANRRSLILFRNAQDGIHVIDREGKL